MAKLNLKTLAVLASTQKEIQRKKEEKERKSKKAKERKARLNKKSTFSPLKKLGAAKEFGVVGKLINKFGLSKKAKVKKGTGGKLSYK